MTISVVVAVKDLAAGAFNRPWFAPSRGSAIRAFSDEVQRAPDKAHGNVMNAHPEDFQLEVLGEWDDENGRFLDCEDQGQVLIRGKDCVAK